MFPVKVALSMVSAERSTRDDESLREPRRALGENQLSEVSVASSGLFSILRKAAWIVSLESL